MNAHFLKLSAYDRWANTRVLEALVDQKPDVASWDKFSHIVLAENAWISRITGTPNSFPNIFESLSEESLVMLNNSNSLSWTKIISETTDFNKVIHYKTINGTETKSTITDILTHIFNHGTYHRATVATLMRQEGHQPVATDFISFTRL